MSLKLIILSYVKLFIVEYLKCCIISISVSNDSILADAIQCVSGLNAIVSSNLALVECLEFFLQWLLIQCEVLLLRCCQFDGSELYLHRTEDFILGLSGIVRSIIQKSPSRYNTRCVQQLIGSIYLFTSFNVICWWLK